MALEMAEIGYFGRFFKKIAIILIKIEVKRAIDTASARSVYIEIVHITIRRFKMPAPLKTFKSGNFEGSIWKNEKDFGDNSGIVQFKTVTVRKTWRDNTNILREQRINLRRNDVEKMLVILKKIQEHLILEDENE